MHMPCRCARFDTKIMRCTCFGTPSGRPPQNLRQGQRRTNACAGIEIFAGKPQQIPIANASDESVDWPHVHEGQILERGLRPKRCRCQCANEPNIRGNSSQKNRRWQPRAQICGHRMCIEHICTPPSPSYSATTTDVRNAVTEI